MITELIGFLINFISENKGTLAVLSLGVFATYLYLTLFMKKQKKQKSLLRGLNNPVFVILESKKKINHDTILLKLKFPGENLQLGLKVGQHIRIYGKDCDGKQIQRNYTPISKIDQTGSLDLLIKVYFPTERFPKGGQMTQYLYNLEEGQRIRISGPKGGMSYLGNSCFYFKGLDQVIKFKKISLIGGGSGITPLYQVMIHLMEERRQKFQISLLFANKTEEDILLREELDIIKESKVSKVFYALDNPKENWKGFKGFVTKQMIEQCFPKPGKDHLILICGPPPMVNSIETICEKLGFDEDNVYTFQLNIFRFYSLINLKMFPQILGHL